jgi:hypothetical protein
MHKICILGNSHVGSLKAAWEKMRSNWPDIDVAFFAQAGVRGLDSVILDGGRLGSDSEHVRTHFVATHGKEWLEIGEYDGFLIYGAGCRTYWPQDAFYSAACVDAAFGDLTEGTPAQHVLALLRAATEVPIYLGHNPLLAARETRSREVSESYLAGIELLNRGHYDKFKARLVGQPLDTIVNGNSTDPVYSWGTPRYLSVNKISHDMTPDTDNTHMNAAFGALWLESFFAQYLLR